jgi:putative DNA primase/helicase
MGGEPLLALADLAGGEWPARARQAASELSAGAQDCNPIGSLLFDIFLMFAMDKQGRMFSRDLAQGLNCLSERPWMELIRLRSARAPQGVTELWLAQQLRPYGVRLRTLRIQEARGKGYLEQDFLEAFRRYIPQSEVEALREELREGAKQQTANS